MAEPYIIYPEDKIYEEDLAGFDNLDDLENLNSNVSSDSSGFSAATMIPALTTALGLVAAETDRKAKSDLLSSQLANASKSFSFKQNLEAQQLRDLDRMLGDKMSASGLEALKAEGRLKAASAETGGTGTSNMEAIQTADVNKMHRDAALLRNAEIQKGNALNSMVASRLGFENRLEGLLSGRTSDISAGLTTYNTALSGLTQGLRFLNVEQKEGFYGTNTTGA